MCVYYPTETSVCVTLQKHVCVLLYRNMCVCYPYRNMCVYCPTETSVLCRRCVVGVCCLSSESHAICLSSKYRNIMALFSKGLPTPITKGMEVAWRGLSTCTHPPLLSSRGMLKRVTAEQALYPLTVVLCSVCDSDSDCQQTTLNTQYTHH